MAVVAEVPMLSSDSRSTAGVLLLTIVFVESGGWFLLQVLRGRKPMTDFQKGAAPQE